MVIVDHDNNCFEYVVRLDFQAMNNVVEYEVAKFKSMIAKKLRVDKITLQSDSKLVVNQFLGTFEAKNGKMKRYLERLRVLKIF